MISVPRPNSVSETIALPSLLKSCEANCGALIGLLARGATTVVSRLQLLSRTCCGVRSMSSSLAFVYVNLYVPSPEGLYLKFPSLYILIDKSLSVSPSRSNNYFCHTLYVLRKYFIEYFFTQSSVHALRVRQNSARKTVGRATDRR